MDGRIGKRKQDYEDSDVTMFNKCKKFVRNYPVGRRYITQDRKQIITRTDDIPSHEQVTKENLPL